MDLHATHIVVQDDVRPARPDGTCFYCRAPLGSQHQKGCVIVSRTVVVEFTVRAVIDVPAEWTKEQIEFRYNESSRCADNTLRQLGEWVEQEREDGRCSCGSVHAKFLGEATEEDHATQIDLHRERG